MITRLLHGDCLKLMDGIPDQSVDMVLCDLPYGTTACRWDNVIPFDPLWVQYNRMLKRDGATGVACVNTGRDFIGMEQDKKYFDIAAARINAASASAAAA